MKSIQIFNLNFQQTQKKELNLKKNEVLYVGDSDVDMITATNAGLESVGVTWGFRDENVLRNNGADNIINSPLELLNLKNL